MSQDPQSRAPDSLKDVELSSLSATPQAGAPLMAARLSTFAGIKATVKVVAGDATASIGELMNLKDGAVLTLDRAVDAPFDVVLDGNVLARGQLVAVGERFGVRITEVCGQLRE